MMIYARLCVACTQAVGWSKKKKTEFVMRSPSSIRPARVESTRERAPQKSKMAITERNGFSAMKPPVTACKQASLCVTNFLSFLKFIVVRHL